MASSKAARAPNFTLRFLLGIMFLAALACGWYSAVWRPEPQPQAPGTALFEAGASAFQRASFREGRLRGAVLRGDVSTFQLAEFDRAELADATLTASGASFQGASFAGANLSGATLTASFSALQQASFADADLSQAQLTCDDTALQRASFAGAKLIGARLACSGQSLQGIDIDAAQFQAADLSQLDRFALESATFTTPPVYDDQTRFPAGFDPVAMKWQRAAKP